MSDALKLNPLQNRTLALLQELARDPDSAEADTALGGVRIRHVPHIHGDHVHIGGLTLSARDASGLANRAVWTVLERKGLIRIEDFPHSLVLLEPGLAFDTGLSGLLAATDHHH